MCGCSTWYYLQMPILQELWSERPAISHRVWYRERGTGKKLLTRDLTLEKCVDTCRSTELVTESKARKQEHPSSSMIRKLEGQVRLAPALELPEDCNCVDVVINNPMRRVQHGLTITQNVVWAAIFSQSANQQQCTSWERQKRTHRSLWGCLDQETACQCCSEQCIVRWNESEGQENEISNWLWCFGEFFTKTSDAICTMSPNSYESVSMVRCYRQSFRCCRRPCSALVTNSSR